MTITFADVMYTLAAPMFTALLVVWTIARILPAEAAARWKLAAGVGAGFIVGYVLLPAWAPLWPNRHWLWLPPLAAIGAILGSVSAGDGIRFWERWLTALALAVIAALSIVPTWDTLQPPRPILLPLVAGYLLLVYALLTALPVRLQGRTFTGLLALSAFATAMLVAYEVSAKFGQLGATLAAALLGATTYVTFSRTSVETDSATDSSRTLFAISNRSLSLIYAIEVGGLAFVAAIEPTPPAWPLLLAPAAPLTLWLFAIPPLSRLQGTPAIALKTISVLIVLAVTAAWLLLAAPAESDDWSAIVGPPAHALSE